jgi:hypothetical protein
MLASCFTDKRECVSILAAMIILHRQAEALFLLPEMKSDVFSARQCT